MRNLKKVIALVAVFAMMISTVAVAQSFSDVAESDNYYEAIEMLSSLGILTGDDQDNDGVMDFRANDTITRAEVAVIISRIQGGNNAAQQSTEFTDVPSTHWASGYIAQAAGQGIVNGYGDGTFGPEDQVLYEQAVKMLVETLGYAPFVNDNGGYYTGHLTAASRYGVLDGVVGTSVGAQATRGQVAQMVYNAIDTPLMDRSTYGTNAEYVIYNGKNDYDYETLLTRYLGVKKFSGIVTKNSVTSLSGKETIDTDDEATIKVDFDENDDYYNYEVEEIDTIYVGESNAEDMIGKYVTAYVKEADRTGEYEVMSIAESSKNKITSFTLDQYDSISSDAANVYYYKNENDRSSTAIKLESKIPVLFNGVYYGGVDAVFDVNDMVKKDSIKSGKVTFIDNDSTSGADVVLVEIGTPAVVDELSTNGRVSFKNSPSVLRRAIVLDFDEEDNTQIIKITKDGKPFDYTELKEWDVLSVLWNPDNDYYDVRVIGSSAIEGTVSSRTRSVTSAIIDGDTGYSYRINGTDYDVAENAYTNGKLDAGVSGVFYIDEYGKIVAYDKNGTTSVSDNYGYVLNAVVADGGFNSLVVKVQLLDKTGAVQSGELAAKVRIDNGKGNLDSANNIEVKDYADEIAEAIMNQLITFKTNSSKEINQITLYQDDEEDGTLCLNATGVATYDEDNSRLRVNSKRFDIEDDTLVFFIKAEDGTLGLGSSNAASKTASKVATAASLGDIDGETVAVYDVDNDVPGVIVCFNTNGGISGTSNIAIIDSIGRASVDGTPVTSVTYFMGGEKHTSVTDIDLDEEVEKNEEARKLEDAEQGDMYKFAVSADGSTITASEWYASFTDRKDVPGEAGAPALTFKTPKTGNKEENFYFGPVVGYNSSRKRIEIATDVDPVIDLNTTQIVDAKDANVYVYDPSRSSNRITVGEASSVYVDKDLAARKANSPVLTFNKSNLTVAEGEMALGVLDYVAAVEYDDEVLDVVIYRSIDFGRYSIVD